MSNATDLPVEKGANSILLNVKEYPNGVYILRVQQGGQAVTRRFIKKQ